MSEQLICTQEKAYQLYRVPPTKEENPNYEANRAITKSKALATGRLRIKPTATTDYTSSQCVAEVDLEAIQPEGNVDVSGAKIGVQIGVDANSKSYTRTEKQLFWESGVVGSTTIHVEDSNAVSLTHTFNSSQSLTIEYKSNTNDADQVYVTLSSSRIKLHDNPTTNVNAALSLAYTISWGGTNIGLDQRQKLTSGKKTLTITITEFTIKVTRSEVLTQFLNGKLVDLYADFTVNQSYATTSYYTEQQYAIPYEADTNIWQDREGILTYVNSSTGGALPASNISLAAIAGVGKNISSGIVSSTVDPGHINVHLCALKRNNPQNLNLTFDDLSKKSNVPGDQVFFRQCRLLIGDILPTNISSGKVNIDYIGTKQIFGINGTIPDGYPISIGKSSVEHLGDLSEMTDVPFARNQGVEAYAMFVPNDGTFNKIDPAGLISYDSKNNYQRLVVGFGYTGDNLLPLPNQFSQPIELCRVKLWISHNLTGSDLEDTVQTLEIGFWLDPAEIGVYTDKIIYTTTDMQQLSLPAKVANLTATSHSYNQATRTGTLSYTVKDKQSLTTITNGFKGKQTLKTLQIPNTVITINPNAFGASSDTDTSYCSNFYQLVGGKIHTIGSNAFRKVPIRQFMFYPTSAKGVIGSYAFANSELRAFTYSTIKSDSPETTFTIGEGAFSNCQNLIRVSLNNGYTMIPTKAFYNTPKLHQFTVPDTVTTIGQSAFENSGITKIDLKKTTTIHDKAFYNCHNLKSVDIFNSQTKAMVSNLTTIGIEAFACCPNLNASNKEGWLWIPYNVQKIDYGAFIECSHKYARIPEALTNIGQSVFKGCSNLHQVNWHATNCQSEILHNDYSTLSDDRVYKMWDIKTGGPFFDIKHQIAHFNIGDQIEVIPPYLCFEFTELQHLRTLTEQNKDTTGNLTGLTKLETIGKYAFAGCPFKKTRTLKLPSSLKEVGEGAFMHTSNLDTAEFNTLKLNKLSDNLFFNSSIQKFTTAISGNSITEVGRNAFRNCINLTTVSLPKSLTTIGYYAFEGCKNLSLSVADISSKNKNNTLYSNIKVIKGYSFHNTKWYEDYENDSNNEGWIEMWIHNVFYRMKNRKKDGELGQFSIDLARATCVSASAFGWQDGIPGGAFGYVKEITNLPQNCLYIGQYAFRGIGGAVYTADPKDYAPTKLQSIDYEAFARTPILKTFTGPSTLSSLGDSVFEKNTKLTEVDLSKCTEITKIPAYLCKSCNKLRNFVFPPNCTEIRHEAFRECTSLSEEFVFPSTIESIGYDAFRGCKNVTQFKFKCGSKIDLGSGVFQNCYALKELYLPKVVELGSDLCKYCRDLETIYYEGSEEEWDNCLHKYYGRNTKLENLTKKGNVKYNQTWEI